MLKHFLTVLAVLAVATTSWAERVDMIKAGAKIDGKTINTKLINQTIERLNKQGGGTLFFPSGTYLTGPIHMKSNITLELEAGATLLFSTNFDDYLPYEPSIPYYNLTVTANNLSDSKYNISYTGNGDGSLSHYASTLQYLEQVSGVFYVNNTNKISDIYMQYEIININETLAPGKNTVIKPVVASNSIYTYAITDKVSIAELGQIKFAVTFGTKNGDIYTAKTNTKYYSPYTYVKNILTKYETANNTENLSYKLTQALYHYSEAANAYF